MPEHGSPAQTRTIALINQKGGVGKTTTTVSIGAALAQAGRRVLLIDLDPQAHATLFLGVNPGAVARTAYDLLLDWDETTTTDLVEARPNLWLMPSETDLAAAESELAAAPEKQRRLANVLAPSLPRFEFVLIDCPPSLGVLTINALVAAREVIIPMQPHFLALQGVGKLLETIGLVREKLNPALRVTGVVVCNHDASASHTQEVIADLVGFFDQARGKGLPWSDAGVLRPFIRRNIKLAESPSFGQTIFDYAPNAPGAADYKALAEVIAGTGSESRAALTEPATNATPPSAPAPAPITEVVVMRPEPAELAR